MATEPVQMFRAVVVSAVSTTIIVSNVFFIPYYLLLAFVVSVVLGLPTFTLQRYELFFVNADTFLPNTLHLEYYSRKVS